ncbi:hypothetical protein [Bittarella massiliensis (ex Durand et al. 2017)]|uniref:Uncharacterized protein n=1 Tax=Bittarella massiliensis (ex Durand et al. 2017) TaxID=1720313 RepID=A0AAW5KI79_9FIRM|nr:hypothetical protein [Bittarella massiliensis (ex Durand et al. 2017)]MCQ4950639.1 hypothetical protein [Bittarella massiliensis (ex Durand et al. 2017)]
MNTPADIIDDAYRYLSVIFAGIFASHFFNLLSSVIRALGDSAPRCSSSSSPRSATWCWTSSSSSTSAWGWPGPPGPPSSPRSSPGCSA